MRSLLKRGAVEAEPENPALPIAPALSALNSLADVKQFVFEAMNGRIYADDPRELAAALALLPYQKILLTLRVLAATVQRWRAQEEAFYREVARYRAEERQAGADLDALQRRGRTTEEDEQAKTRFHRAQQARRDAEALVGQLHARQTELTRLIETLRQSLLSSPTDAPFEALSRLLGDHRSWEESARRMGLPAELTEPEADLRYL